MTLPEYSFILVPSILKLYRYKDVQTFDNVVVEGIFGIVLAVYIEQAFMICLILGKQEFWFFVILVFVDLPVEWTWSDKQTIL